MTRNVLSVEPRLVSRDPMQAVKGHEMTMYSGHMLLVSVLEWHGR